jgi:drug/metabolite transporter (DMT)-like permease
LMEWIALSLGMMATLCWGMDQVLGKVAVRSVHPFLFNAIRVSFAAAVILAVLPLAEVGFGSAGLVALAAASGLAGEFLAAEIYFIVMRKNPAHLTIPVGNTDPLWGALWSVVIFGGSVGVTAVVSLVFVVGGTFLLAGGAERSGGWRGGIAAAALVALIWGLMLPLAKVCLNGGMTPQAYQAVRIGSAAVGCLVFWLVAGRPAGSASRRVIAITLASGFLAFFLGFVLWLAALERETAGSMAPLLGGKVAFGFLLSAALLEERAEARSVAGAFLIFAGMILAAL